jgi:mannose-6-phosphate isomerase-like protein (cupin superfamily)
MTASLDFLGTIAIIRQANDGTPAGLSVVEHRAACGYATPLHIHQSEDELFYIQSGTICLEVAGRMQTVGAGAVVLAPRGIPHRFIVTAPEGAVALTFVAGADFEGFVREVSRPTTASVPPAPTPPSAEMMRLATAAAARHAIDLVGPPLTLADLRERAA